MSSSSDTSGHRLFHSTIGTPCTLTVQSTGINSDATRYGIHLYEHDTRPPKHLRATTPTTGIPVTCTHLNITDVGPCTQNEDAARESSIHGAVWRAWVGDHSVDARRPVECMSRLCWAWSDQYHRRMIQERQCELTVQSRAPMRDSIANNTRTSRTNRRRPPATVDTLS